LEGKWLHDVDHEDILEERMRRVALDHEEMTSVEYYDSSDESDHHDDEDESDDEMQEGDDNEE
jgi:hypothetical protein